MAKARVIARNYSTEDSVVVETDEQGKYELELVKGTWQLEGRTENLGASNFAKINDVDLEDLNFDLDSLVDVKGNNEKLKSQILILKGMARSVKVDDQGSWSFKELPKGAYIT